ncbi:cupredoxin domain-containing protein [Paenibacillus methanolicus]|uniref:Cupredoxin-like domain-containing protein n=1 Tax=Paenibacillus methanolicus TaxID=582686 RepID=A0A5S5BTI9_9BACL|nr:cupredoxin domain-containing protein [Paenibacillus methanolicus]TYP70327.1 Cupredoxin-like domain-containing protein [Paenibacillus methanolicus]
MTNIFVITKKQIKLFAVLLLALVVAVVCFKWNQSQAAMATPSQTRVMHLVTGEFEARDANNKKIEAYLWSPSSIFVNAGEEVELHLTGISGESHPFVIEGLGIQGTVEKGKTTVVKFKAEKKGTYPIICQTHDTREHNGPMVGYIYVQ